MTQALLFPDPRPLVERLGPDFFHQAPEVPGVYLMRDAVGAVLYVGKAKNLRKRLGSYRVANPDRLARRHLRLLRTVARIDLQECASEQAALARESELLRNLRPRFNRAGTWPGTPRFLLWRLAAEGVLLCVAGQADTGWRSVGPLGAGADIMRAALARLLWCAVHSGCSAAQLPHSWFRGRHSGVTTISFQGSDVAGFEELESSLGNLFEGRPEQFCRWVEARRAEREHPFDTAARQADLETVNEFAQKKSALERS